MAIPWDILTYPGGDKPKTLGIKVMRYHSRHGYHSTYANLGRPSRPERAGDWVAVQLPARGFQRELLMLPFLAAGATERDDVFDHIARAGVDVRYRPTPQLTALMTVNPDFQNVEGQVEGIDFTRNERFVGESRPFFQEGRGMFSTGSGMGTYFYSRRVENIDMGAKLYGKLAQRTDMGFLGAFDFAGHDGDRMVQQQDYITTLSQGFGEATSASVTAVKRDSAHEQNTVFAYYARTRITRNMSVQARYGSSAWRGVEPGQAADVGADPDSAPLVYRRGDLGHLSMNASGGTFYIRMNLGFLSPEFRSSNGFFQYQGRRSTGVSFGASTESRDSMIRSVGVNFGANYSERYSTGNGFEGIDEFLSRAISSIDDRDANDAFFRDSATYRTNISLDNNLRFSHSASISHFRDEGAEVSDRDWATNWSAGFTSENLNRSVRAGYSFGRTNGVRRHFPSVRGSWKKADFAMNFNASILRHTARRQQHILGLNYDLTDAIGVSGRLVFRRNDITGENTWNPYIAFRRSGATGIETFLILGDPSGATFTPRMEGKVLLPL